MSQLGSFDLKFTEEVIQRLFGHEAAEDESPQRLKEYYVKSGAYESMRADLPLRILVGHKGIGKSALFTIAQSEDDEAGSLSVSIKPDDISEVETGEQDFNRKINQWKTGLLRIIQRRVFERLGIQALEQKSALSVAGKVIMWLKDTTAPYLEGKADINPTERLLLDNFLQSGTLTVYLDDLDRGWKGSAQDVERVSALLNALRDLSNANKGLRFRVALRSDVFFLVRTSDESTDKLESSVIWYSWTNHEILALLAKKILTFFGESAETSTLLKMSQPALAQIIARVMVPVFRGRGRWSSISVHRMLMTMVRKRPRDMVKLCTLAARRAREAGHTIIQTDDFSGIFEEYSQGRIQDTINEHRTELPEVDRLIMNMKPAQKSTSASDSYLFTEDQLLKKIRGICSQGKFLFATKKDAGPKELASFLYKINFLTARKDTGSLIIRKYFEESRYIYSTIADFGFDWEIHPAYRWALQPTDFEQLFDSIAPEN